MVAINTTVSPGRERLRAIWNLEALPDSCPDKRAIVGDLSHLEKEEKGKEEMTRLWTPPCYEVPRYYT